MAGSDVVAAARDWLGVTYRHQGRDRTGVDCIGLVVCAFADIGIQLQGREDYGREPFNGELEAEIYNYFDPVPEAQPGDVFLMSFAGNPISHTAIYTGKNIIHAYSPVGRVVELPFRNNRPARLRQVVRYKEWQQQHRL